MGLDKWIKPENDAKKIKKKKESPVQTKKSINEDTKKKIPERSAIQLTRYILECTSAKCKYQKIIMKKELTDDDLICPRCKKKMKTKVK